MEIALVDGQRHKAMPSLKGVCPMCSRPAVPKCGEKLVWHWAHRGKHCDPWWENETDWHRDWKALFPIDWQEVIQHDEITGEKHIADVRDPQGVVFEFQHSAMPLEELRAREAFYKRMIWIVDAKPFAAQFEVQPHKLPDPKSYLCKDAVFTENGIGFWRPSERDPELTLVEMHPRRPIEAEIEKEYRGHHFYKWKRPRTVWLEAKKTVLLDFGTNVLLWLERYGHQGTPCVRRVSKADFVLKMGGRI